MFLDASIPQTFSLAGVGILIVFAALIVVLILIKLIAVFAVSIEKKEDKSEPLPETPAPAPEAAPVPEAKPAVPAGMVPAKGSLGEVKLYDTEEKTAAMIMAIVSDELKAPLNELRFISIRTK